MRAREGGREGGRERESTRDAEARGGQKEVEGKARHVYGGKGQACGRPRPLPTGPGHAGERHEGERDTRERDTREKDRTETGHRKTEQRQGTSCKSAPMVSPCGKTSAPFARGRTPAFVLLPVSGWTGELGALPGVSCSPWSCSPWSCSPPAPLSFVFLSPPSSHISDAARAEGRPCRYTWGGHSGP